MKKFVHFIRNFLVGMSGETLETIKILVELRIILTKIVISYVNCFKKGKVFLGKSQESVLDYVRNDAILSFYT